MADKPVARPMKYPYTLSAKIAQFPLKMYLTKNWIWKYYAVALVVTAPVMYKIHKLVNSPENVAKWAMIKKKEAAEAHHH